MQAPSLEFPVQPNWIIARNPSPASRASRTRPISTPAIPPSATEGVLSARSDRLAVWQRPTATGQRDSIDAQAQQSRRIRSGHEAYFILREARSGEVPEEHRESIGV